MSTIVLELVTILLAIAPFFYRLSARVCWTIISVIESTLPSQLFLPFYGAIQLRRLNRGAERGDVEYSVGKATTQRLAIPPGHEYLETRSSFIAAENAFKHVESKSSIIEEVLSSYGIADSNYGISAGFDQNALKRGLGRREEIQIFIRSEKEFKSAMPSLLLKLESIVSPFPGIVINVVASEPLRVYMLPAIDGETFCGSEVPVASSSRLRGQPGDDHDVELRGGKGNEVRDGEGEQLGLGSGPPGGEGDLVKHFSAEVTIEVDALICASPPGQVNRDVTQHLSIKGKFLIKNTSEGKKFRQFPTCNLEFEYLRCSNDFEKSPYAHLSTTVRINVHSKIALLDKFKPQRTLEFARQRKITTSSKMGSTSGISSSFSASVAPQGNIGASKSWTRENTIAEERIATIATIAESDILGAIKWAFFVDDANEKKRGRILDPDEMPMAQFTFVGTSDIPAAPPPTIDVEISSTWSSFDVDNPKTIRGYLAKVFHGRKPFRSNLVQINELKIPSNLEGKFDHLAELGVFPRQTLQGVTICELETLRNSEPTNATVSVKDTDKVFDLK